MLNVIILPFLKQEKKVNSLRKGDISLHLASSHHHPHRVLPWGLIRDEEEPSSAQLSAASTYSVQALRWGPAAEGWVTAQPAHWQSSQTKVSCSSSPSLLGYVPCGPEDELDSGSSNKSFFPSFLPSSF